MTREKNSLIVVKVSPEFNKIIKVGRGIYNLSKFYFTDSRWQINVSDFK